MLTPEELKRQGYKPEQEKSPLEILEETKMAMTTREIANAIQKNLPANSITNASVKQKMIRLEKKGLVIRRKFKGITHWLKA